MSCPQPCIQPFCYAKGMPEVSRMGRASISARSLSVTKVTVLVRLMRMEMSSHVPASTQKPVAKANAYICHSCVTKDQAARSSTISPTLTEPMSRAL